MCNCKVLPGGLHRKAVLPKSDWIHNQGIALLKRVAVKPGPWPYLFIVALVGLGAFIGSPIFQGLQQRLCKGKRGTLISFFQSVGSDSKLLPFSLLFMSMLHTSLGAPSTVRNSHISANSPHHQRHHSTGKCNKEVGTFSE